MTFFEAMQDGYEDRIFSSIESAPEVYPAGDGGTHTYTFKYEGDRNRFGIEDDVANGRTVCGQGNHLDL